MNDRLTEVGERVKARRLELPGAPTQSDIAADADVSLMTIGNLERGNPINDRNRAKLSQALGWTPDSIDRLLSGEEPIDASTNDQRSMDDRVTAIESEVGEIRAMVTQLVEQFEEHRKAVQALMQG